MKISIEIDGNPDQLAQFIAGGLAAGIVLPPSLNFSAAQARAEQIGQEIADRTRELLETAVKDGSVTILLGEVTEQRKRQLAGVL